MLGDSKTAPAGAAAMPEALDGYALCFQATLARNSYTTHCLPSGFESRHPRHNVHSQGNIMERWRQGYTYP